MAIYLPEYMWFHHLRGLRHAVERAYHKIPGGIWAAIVEIAVISVLIWFTFHTTQTVH